ncbi:unnamed protein product [Phytophthora lilii]|uniref:Unnamed protein product n=1 Tax=Phytophthora lilii TaxID=2077276 RepID=A0A9W6TWQ6_9STRA|nr:unnamed protein product [Phytophthora lilii]
MKTDCDAEQYRATATGCRLFREKQVQKEYLAVVRGHLPFNPADSVDSTGAPAKPCTFSKLGMLIQDMEELERLRNQQRGTRAHQKMAGYPRGARHGPNLFTMEQAQLLRESQGDPRGEVRGTTAGAGARELTPAELAFTKMTWHDLTKEEKDAYTEKAKADKQRFLREFSVFLSQEKVRVARKRKYKCLDRDNSEEADEPVAYIFDAPIIEPHRSTGVFRMQVGTETSTIAKQSTTIAFVLGHATYNGEPVTKVLLRPLNGRRHQLRLHLAHHGFPIAGDVTYGSQEDEAPRMMLHAWRIWLRGRPADQVIAQKKRDSCERLTDACVVLSFLLLLRRNTVTYISRVRIRLSPSCQANVKSALLPTTKRSKQKCKKQRTKRPKSHQNSVSKLLPRPVGEARRVRPQLTDVQTPVHNIV